MSFDEIKYEKKNKTSSFPRWTICLLWDQILQDKHLLDLKYKEKPQSVNLPRASSFAQ